MALTRVCLYTRISTDEEEDVPLAVEFRGGGPGVTVRR